MTNLNISITVWGFLFTIKVTLHFQLFCQILSLINSQSSTASNSLLSLFTMLNTMYFFFLVHSNSLSIKSNVIKCMKPPINVRWHTFPLARSATTVPWIIQAERLQSMIRWQWSVQSGRSSSHWRAPLSNRVWQVKTKGTGLLSLPSSHYRSAWDWDFSWITAAPRKPQGPQRTDRCWKWILSIFKLAWLLACCI